VAESVTEKGQNLLARAKTADVTADDIKKRQQVQEKNEKELKKHKLKCPSSYLPKLLEKAYNHDVWQEKAATCFACGSCNQVCPTCYCFGVQDDVSWDMKTGSRCRAWDGCMLDGFAKVAGDHDFRKNRADRFRHRLYRKAKYVPEKIGGEMACVGCGRCIGACLPDIANPVTVYNQLVDDLGLG
jgi:ferredoxin